MFLIAFILGAIFGSFMNVLIYRLPRSISILFPGSNCPSCGKTIKFYENIPILSYLFLKGRCSSCNTKISITYPVVELFTAIFFTLIYLKFGVSLLTLSMLTFVFFILTAGFTDLFTAFDKDRFECGVIPSVILYGGIILGLLFSFFNGLGFLNSLAGAFLGYISLFLPSFIYKLWRKVEGMGDGDMYLMGMVGAFLGIKSIFPVIFFASFIGALIGLIIIKIYRDKNFPIPFGPFITLSSLFYIFYGERLMDSYLNMLRH
ncbi:MAG: prepilin peptidase [Calditerrivibrio sp.]|nr:prepilin peptidase [Calditerrivibrio sp.]MCA1980299.1 prepilin peptidase [Calditerrivibrio sp.]